MSLFVPAFAAPPGRIAGPLEDIQNQLNGIQSQLSQLDDIQSQLGSHATEVLLASNSILLRQESLREQIGGLPPAWSQGLPASERFVVLADLHDGAVLDRETGLVWDP